MCWRLGDSGAPGDKGAEAALEVRPPGQRAAAGRWLVVSAAWELQLGRLSMLVVLLVRGRDDGLKILV